MVDGVGVGLGVGLAVALPISMLTVLLVALWQGRPRPVAIAALGGAATADAVLAIVGLAVGSAIAFVVPAGGLRASIAAALLLAIVVRVGIGLLLGPYGVAGNAVLPTTVGGAWVRILAVTLMNPVLALGAAAVALVRPDLATGDGWAGLVAGFVVAGLGWRLIWATTASRRRGLRLERRSQIGLGLASVVVLAAFVLRLAG